MAKWHTQQLLLAWQERVAASFDLSHQVLTCQRSSGFALKQTERLFVPFSICYNDMTRIVAATSPKAKASRHNNVSLNNISYSHTSLRRISFDNELHCPFLLVHIATILQSIFSCNHGLFCPIKAQDTRAIMDGQYHDKKKTHTLWNH